jgi:hypothetical protein
MTMQKKNKKPPSKTGIQKDKRAINLHKQGQENCGKKEGKGKTFTRNPPPINSSSNGPARTVI